MLSSIENNNLKVQYLSIEKLLFTVLQIVLLLQPVKTGRLIKKNGEKSLECCEKIGQDILMQG